jgi:glycosyltransferase involved in cell wall biosynthesis
VNLHTVMVKWVSVIVVMKDSHRTVRKSVDALLAQTYRGPVEVIVVSDRDDSIWELLHQEIDSGQVLTVEVDGRNGGCDDDRRRNAGINAACGDVLCLTDGDMVPAPDLVATGVSLLGNGWSCAAGPVASVDATIPTNLFLDREVFERVGAFDPEWVERAADAGYEILRTPRLLPYHHQRPGWHDPAVRSSPARS